MTKDKEKGRLILGVRIGIYLIGGLLLVVLVLRLMSMQLWNYDFYQAKNEANVVKERILQSSRGTIYDRNNQPLAVSAVTKSLYVDPRTLRSDTSSDMKLTLEELADKLSPYVHTSKEDLLKMFHEDSGFIWIQRMMDPDDAKAVQDIKKEYNVTALAFREESKRFYPNGNLLAQVLGFVGEEDKGLEGLEMVLNDEIRSNTSSKRLRFDNYGNPIFETILEPFLPEKERTVKLTIDATVQFIAERALDASMAETKAVGASVIVMDPKTGEILALANRPTYDPNFFGKGTLESFRNRAVVDAYEPGSTLKPIISAIALDAKTWSIHHTYEDKGVITIGGKPLQNWNGEGYGTVRLLEILKFSLNTGMAYIGLQTTGPVLIEGLKRFGFEHVTDIEMPGEAEGALFDPANMSDRDVVSTAIGQAVSVTPLQMVKAFGALANHGKLMRPHLIKAIYNADGTVYKETEIREEGRAVSEQTVADITDILVKEVSEGGGNNAYVSGYRFAGKTGTAEKIDPKGGGYLAGQYIASFIGYGPVEDAKLVVLVVIDNPTGSFYGSQIAAPVFKDMMSQLVRYYKLSPTESKETKDQAKTEEGEESRDIPEVTHDEEGKVILPNFTGWTTGEVRNWLHSAKLGFRPEGTGYAISQLETEGTTLSEGAYVTVYFTH